MGKLNVHGLVVGPIETNCYLAENTETKETLIIDPGDEAGRIRERIKEVGGKPVAILLTHGHFDHVRAAAELEREYGVQTYVHEEDLSTLHDPVMNGCGMIGRRETYDAGVTVKDGEVLSLAGFEITVLFTPGHTPGGCCYYFPSEKVLFSGDTLFRQSIGRTDFPKGSERQLVGAIREKILPLSEDTVVYPGHMGTTTVREERAYNPWVQSHAVL